MTQLPDIDALVRALALDGPPASRRVVVAMSGGVDSSVVAGLLKHAGYDVVGVTLQLYDHGETVRRPGSCCAGQDVHDARRVAEQLGIPHYVLDYEERFREAVIDSFADSYVAGETPIPCVSCNQKIKFKDLLSTARELGAVALATGHYIRSVKGPRGWEMHRPKDAGRDQSYFLFATTREQLAFLRFPLGDYTKAETRAFAQALDLPVAAKSDSQDICFVPAGHYSDVIERLRPGATRAGDIVHADGRVLGRHKGIVGYTIGQRRGIGIASGEPLYVVRLDAGRHQVVVGPREMLRIGRLWLREVNWMAGGGMEEACRGGLDLFVRLRSTAAPQPALLHARREGDGLSVTVDLPDGEDGVAPGQACVFYSAAEGPARVLGGGIIARTQSAFDMAGAMLAADAAGADRGASAS